MCHSERRTELRLLGKEVLRGVFGTVRDYVRVE